MNTTLEAKAKMSFADIDDIDIKRIEDIDINMDLPVQDRIKEYITVNDNPYFLFVDGTKVKFSFRATGPDIQDVLKTITK